MKYEFEVKFYENALDNKVKFKGIFVVDDSTDYTINQVALEIAKQTNTFYGNVKFIKVIKEN